MKMVNAFIILICSVLIYTWRGHDIQYWSVIRLVCLILSTVASFYLVIPFWKPMDPAPNIPFWVGTGRWIKFWSRQLFYVGVIASIILGTHLISVQSNRWLSQTLLNFSSQEVTATLLGYEEKVVFPKYKIRKKFFLIEYTTEGKKRQQILPLDHLEIRKRLLEERLPLDRLDDHVSRPRLTFRMEYAPLDPSFIRIIPSQSR